MPGPRFGAIACSMVLWVVVDLDRRRCGSRWSLVSNVVGRGGAQLSALCLVVENVDKH